MLANAESMSSRTRKALRVATWGASLLLLPLALATHAALLIALAWPAPTALLATRGEALVILDRHGAELASLATTPGGSSRSAWLPLSDVPTIAMAVVLHSEDEHFWQHGGIDGRGIARALWLNARAGRIAYGGSTLTMQVARMLISAGQRRSAGNKAAEALLALRLERALSKREILEQWFNRAYFGNGAYGLAAAAQLYFGKDAEMLSSAEAALLAVLPRAPGRYDPLMQLQAATARRDAVIARLQRSGLLGVDEAAAATASIAVSRHEHPATRAPHFVAWVIEQLPPHVRAGGGEVTTTLDLALQERLERALAMRLEAVAEFGVRQAGLVVLDSSTGQVLAMVGSANWQGEDGQLNIATRRRNPGSALKPFVYAAALERGDTPFSIAYDLRDVSANYVVPSAGVEHGPVTYREALAGSYNFAAVDVLERTGIGTVMTLLKKAGVADLAGDPRDYGLRLALGSAKVRLVDLVAGFGFLVRGGVVRHVAATISVQARGAQAWRPPQASETRVVSDATAWLVMDILADRDARGRVFGRDNPFDLPFDVAAKTGTMRGFADTVAVAATEQVLVGAWAGNFDGQPSHGALAMDVAAPLVREALLSLHAARPLTLPPRPANIIGVQVCATSGMKPGPHCPRQRAWAQQGGEPTHSCDWHDAATGQLRYPPRAARWARAQWARAQSAPAPSAEPSQPDAGSDAAPPPTP
ncbi:MAG: transglycosylase domain-containing protein [Myxococcales bacterium]|nr:transglycosylase domain-containing protein [Myxococcales bacterium]